MDPVLTPAVAARRIDLGTKLLVGYAVAAAVALVTIGATTTEIHVFSRTALALVAAGWVLLIAVGVMHRRTRRELIRQRPDMASLLGRRVRPGGGWAVLVYLPLLLAVVSIGSVSLAVAHPPSGVLAQCVVVVIFLKLAAVMEVWYDRNIRAPYLAALRAGEGAPTVVSKHHRPRHHARRSPRGAHEALPRLNT